MKKEKGGVIRPFLLGAPGREQTNFRNYSSSRLLRKSALRFLEINTNETTPVPAIRLIRINTRPAFDLPFSETALVSVVFPASSEALSVTVC